VGHGCGPASVCSPVNIHPEHWPIVGEKLSNGESVRRGQKLGQDDFCDPARRYGEKEGLRNGIQFTPRGQIQVSFFNRLPVECDEVVFLEGLEAGFR
jgi:hypothetical protein